MNEKKTSLNEDTVANLIDDRRDTTSEASIK